MLSPPPDDSDDFPAKTPSGQFGAVPEMSSEGSSEPGHVPSTDSDGSSPPVTILPGQILLGQYLMKRKLGEGGMGSVWLVEDQVLKTDRALKLIGARLAEVPSSRARFHREAQVMARIKHNHAVVVHIEGSSYRMRQHADLLPPVQPPSARPDAQPKRRGRPPKVVAMDAG